MVNGRLTGWLSGLLVAALPILLHAAHPSEAERIVSTDAGATELILALGAGNALVAVDVTSKVPAALSALPNVGYHRNLSAEGLLAIRPSLVVGGEHIGPAAVIRTLQRAGITVVQLPTATRAEEVRANVEQLAEALGRPEAALPVLASLQETLDGLAQLRPTHLRAAFLLATEPGRLRLAGRHTSGAALLDALGAINVAEYPNYRTVSAESLMALRPDLILVAGNDPASDVARLMSAYPVLARSPAGIHHRILPVDGSALVAGLSLAAMDEALRLARHLSHTSTGDIDDMASTGEELVGKEHAVQGRTPQ